MAGTYIFVQPNGERLPVEWWAYEAWRHGNMTDPLLRRVIENAVRSDSSHYVEFNRSEYYDRGT